MVDRRVARQPASADSAQNEAFARGAVMSASTPSLRPPSAPPRAASAPASRVLPLTRHRPFVVGHLPASNDAAGSNGTQSAAGEHIHEPSSVGSDCLLPPTGSADQRQPSSHLMTSSGFPPETDAHWLGSDTASNVRSLPLAAAFNAAAADYSTAGGELGASGAAPAAGAGAVVGAGASFGVGATVGGVAGCSKCRVQMESMTRELSDLRAELTSNREMISRLRDKEKQLRERLSEQARRQLEKGSTVFEDVNLGGNRPTQLVRRYGNLYAETRLDALDALDDLIEVAQFKNLKGKLLLSVVVLAFRNARKNHDEIKAKVKKLLHIPEVTGSTTSSTATPRLTPRVGAGKVASNALNGAQLDDSDVMVKELDDVISMYLRKTVEQHNLTKNYEEVCDRVWATLYDFPNLRRCRGLLKYIDECVRLAWALSIQNPPLVIDYEAKLFHPDTHSRFHSSDADSDVIKCVLWPMLREGEGGPCVYKGVVIT